MHWTARTILALLLLCTLAPNAAALPAGWDPSFGNGEGFVGLSARRGANFASAMTQQADGKYLIAGSSSGAGSQPDEFYVVRLTLDGVRDSTFGEGGVAYVPVSGASGNVTSAIALQADGRIIIGGLVDSEPTLLRITANGRPDSSFGTAGFAPVPISSFGEITALQLQADGTLFVVGYANSVSVSGYVARMLPSGAPDPAWDGDGVLFLSPQPWTQLYGIVLVGGAPLLVGESAPNYASSRFLTLVKLTPSGAYDTAFDTDGIVFTAAGLNSGGRSAALQTSVTTPTKIVVAGYAQQGQTGKDFLVARYSLTGQLDVTFDGDGILLKPVGPTAYDDIASSVRVTFTGGTATRIVVAGNIHDAFNGRRSRAAMKLFLAGTFDTAFDGDGVLVPPGFGDCSGMLTSGSRIVMTGSGDRGADRDVAVSRHSTTDGTADATFGTAGWSFIDAGHSPAEGHAIALQSDGKILIGGQGQGSDVQPIIRRVYPDGRPDSSFAGGGVQDSLPLESAGGTVRALVVQPDGRIVAVGSYPVSSGSSMFVTRLLSNGAIDRTFGTLGITRIHRADYDTLYSIALQSDGRIVVAGVVRSNSVGSSFAVFRLTTNGVLDPTFGPFADGSFLDASGLFDASATAVTLAADGRILVAGRARQTVSGPFRALVYRLASNGAFDPSFNGFGRVVVPFGSESATPMAIAEGTSSSVVVAGYTNAAGATPFVLRRLASGAADSSFAGDGEARLPVRNAADFVNAMALRPTGHIVLGGTNWVAATQRRGTLARLTPSGALDTSFGVAGRLDFPYENYSTDEVKALAFDAQGRAVTGGTLSSLLGIVRLQPEVVPTAVGDGDAPRGSLRFGAPAPNPARDGTSFVLTMPVAGAIEVAVHDVSGRRVRTLHAGVMTAGAHTLRWDGRDASGRGAEPGLYFVRARAGEQSASTRIVRMR